MYIINNYFLSVNVIYYKIKIQMQNIKQILYLNK